MYYELGTMVCIRKDASPFVNHEKGIGYPRFDVIGEIVATYPSILSYVVRLSKKFTLTFSEDDIYELPDCISSRRDMFHKMLGSIIQADARSFYSVKVFEDFIKRAENQSTMYFPNYRYDPKFIENMMYPVKSSITALEELNRREFERIAAEPIRIDIDDAIKANYSKEEIKKMINNTFGVPKFEYKKIIFSGPCTIILWKDGTKTIAKASGGDVFDPEKGVAICFMKKMLGHTETNKILRAANKQYEDYIAENGLNISFDEFIDFCKHSFKSETKPVDHIDQSTIEEVKKVEEEQDDNLAVGSRCSTCVYYDKPMTKDPCCHCLRSGDQYEKREEEEDK